MVRGAGVDGCRGGWVVATELDAFVCPDFGAVLAALPDDAVIGVDIPIGLFDDFVPGGRDPDREARGLLGRKGSSVFSAPVRRAFGAYLREAQSRGCRMTLQAVGIMAKVEEVDRHMTPMLQERVLEVHPELSFCAMNGGPVMSPKKKPRGRAERRRLLEREGIVVPERPHQRESEDDLLDACAALWSMRRYSLGESRRVPEQPERDSRGLRMEINW